MLIGADNPVGDWRVGLLAGYSQSSSEVNDRAASGSSDNYHLGLYGGTEWGNLAFRTGAAYTWHDIDTNRSVSIPGLSNSLSANYNAGTFQAFGELGYGIDIGNTRFEPFASLADVSLHTDSFTEQGGNAGLSVHGGNADVTYTTLGLRGEHTMTLGTIDATLRGMVAWRHAFGDTMPESTHAFSAGDAFTIAVIEAGLDLDLTPGATFGLSYLIPTHIAPRPPLRRRSIALEMVGQRRTKMASFRQRRRYWRDRLYVPTLASRFARFVGIPRFRPIAFPFIPDGLSSQALAPNLRSTLICRHR